MNKPVRILIVEDSKDDALLLERAMLEDGICTRVRRVDQASEMARALRRGKWDLVIADYVMPRFGALDALRLLKKQNLDLPLIVVSGKIDEEKAVSVLRAGAHDFVTKGNLTRLVPAIRRELKDSALRKRHRVIKRARRESEDRYRRLAESITDIFFAVDKNVRCTYWNKAAENHTGVSSSAAIGKTAAELFSGMAEPAIADLLRQAASGSAAKIFSTFITRGAERRYFEWKVYPSHCGLSLIAHDGTDRKRAEEMQATHGELRRQIEEARELRFLGQLTSGVAHEVRNPLNAIATVSESLFNELRDRPEFTEHKRHIRTHVNRLTELMQELLDFGRPMERSRLRKVSLREIIENSIDVWKSGATANGCELRMAVDPDCADLCVHADEGKLQQVFLNLLDNAAQHNVAGAPLSLVLSSKKQHGRILVIDKGKGIEREHLPRIFEPFFTTRKKGTGLGLSIVKNIVDAHGGSIGIQNNEPPPGCTAEVCLPLFAG